MTVKAGSGKGTQFTRMIGGSASIRPEATPAGKGAGGRKIRIGGSCSQMRHGIGDIRGRYSLRREPGADRLQRSAAAIQRLHSPGSIGRIVEQTRFAVARDKRIYHRRNLWRGYG